MAKKHHKKKHHKRRVSGGLKMSNPLVMGGIGALAGFFGDQFLGFNTMIDKMLPGTVTVPATASTPAITTPTSTMSGITIAAEGGIAAGLLLWPGGSKTTKTIKHLGGGFFAGLAVRRVLKQMKVISGFDAVPVLGGFRNVPVIGGLPNALSGLPNALSGGYKVGAGYTVGRKVMGAVNGFGSGYNNGDNSGYHKD